ncbi:MAG: CRISPR-associated endonuclease Cas2 [Spirochaetales bacterium]|nr:CRISPR-associated endonuclease Cas2 [Spirochaetales bacterium]
MKSSEYLVVYDISADKERTKVQKLLEGYGFGIQKSVFECLLSRGLKRELIKKLEKLNIKTGFIKLYRYDKTIKNTIIGVYDRKDPDKGNAFIV